MLSGLLKISGFLILRLVYGKEKYEEKRENDFLAILLSGLCAFWIICLLVLFNGAKGEDLWLGLIYGIGYPVAILVWAITVRKTMNKGV